MAVISDIKTTKKGRYALFCDDEFLFSVDEATLCEFRLKAGMTLSDEQIIRLKDSSDSRRALNKAMDYLDLRDHSSGELREKLLRSFDEDTADYAIAYLKRLDYVNDSSFAERYAEELLVRKHKSMAEARACMYKKQVGREESEAALSVYDNIDFENAAYLAENKYAGKPREKTAASLLRRGFNGAAVRAAIGRVYDD